MENEGGELKPPNQTKCVGVGHILAGEHDVVFRRDIVHQVVVEDETEKTVKKSQINLFVYLRQDCLHENIAFPVSGLPHVGQVVDPWHHLYTPVEEAAQCPQA